jgi:hypothetical protein
MQAHMIHVSQFQPLDWEPWWTIWFQGSVPWVHGHSINICPDCSNLVVLTSESACVPSAWIPQRGDKFQYIFYMIITVDTTREGVWEGGLESSTVTSAWLWCLGAKYSWPAHKMKNIKLEGQKITSLELENPTRKSERGIFSDVIQYSA